jgi:hypothetical protein
VVAQSHRPRRNKSNKSFAVNPLPPHPVPPDKMLNCSVQNVANRPHVPEELFPPRNITEPTTNKRQAWWICERLLTHGTCTHRVVSVMPTRTIYDARGALYSAAVQIVHYRKTKSTKMSDMMAKSLVRVEATIFATFSNTIDGMRRSITSIVSVVKQGLCLNVL